MKTDPQRRIRCGQAFFEIGKLDDAALARLREVSPANAVHQGMAPFLTIHGTANEQVACELSPSMCEAIKKAGGRCDLITVEGGKHGMGSWDKSPEMQHWTTSSDSTTLTMSMAVPRYFPGCGQRFTRITWRRSMTSSASSLVSR